MSGPDKPSVFEQYRRYVLDTNDGEATLALLAAERVFAAVEGAEAIALARFGRAGATPEKIMEFAHMVHANMMALEAVEPPGDLEPDEPEPDDEGADGGLPDEERRGAGPSR